MNRYDQEFLQLAQRIQAISLQLESRELTQLDIKQSNVLLDELETLIDCYQDALKEEEQMRKRGDKHMDR